MTTETTTAQTASAKSSQEAELAAVNDDLARIVQHQEAGRLTEAGAMIDALLARYEGNPRFTHLKALNLYRAGRFDEAQALLRQVLAHEPKNAEVLIDLGTVLASSGAREEATGYFREATEIAPNLALAHGNLGAALVLEKKYREAIAHLQRAIALDGAILDVHMNLAQALLRTNQFQPAIDVLYKALAIDPQSPAAHSNLAQALFRRERHEAAEHHARRAIELAQGALEPWQHLGNILAASGKMDEAAEALMKVARHPGLGIGALGRLVHLRKVTPDSPEQALLTAQAARMDELPKEAQVTLGFALAKAAEDQGDPAAAFDHYRQANATTRALHPFDADRHVARVARLREVVSPALIARASATALEATAPVFICGMPRSGTTLTEQMFSRHPKVQAGGELPAAMVALGHNARLRTVLEGEESTETLTTDDFARLGEDYLDRLQTEGLRAEYVTDKMPGNYMYLGLLAMALPRARFLIMRRHPLDCLLSNWVQNFGQNQPFSSDFHDMATVYREFDGLARHWQALFPDRVRQVPYEALVEAPEARMRELLAFAGLEWDAAVLDHTASMRQVNTASVAQVRQPVYRSSVARWQRYGPLLHDLAVELRDHLSADELAACGVTPSA